MMREAGRGQVEELGDVEIGEDDRESYQAALDSARVQLEEEAAKQKKVNRAERKKKTVLAKRVKRKKKAKK